jgi:Ion channel
MLLRKPDRSVPEESFLRRFYRWRNRGRDPALTAMLATQILLIAVGAPYAASGAPDWSIGYDLFRILIGFLTVLISRGLIVTGTAIVALAIILSGNVFDLIEPSPFLGQLSHLGSIVGSVIVGVVVCRAVLAPGPLTTHRVLGAIVVYLNFGLIAAAIYHVIWDFYPAAFHGITTDFSPAQATGALVYFSFVTLTTAGYGDIVAVNAFARGVVNLEAIIGQLYPATTLARFVTLEMEARRR